jgi:outer membrane protein insertion porin family
MICYAISIVSFAFVFSMAVIRAQETTQQKTMLDFEGNQVFSKQELLEVANKCLTEFSKYRDEDNEHVLEYCLHRVRLSMFSKGYLQAKLGEPRREQTEHGAKTIVSVDEGALFRVGEIEINESKLFSPSQIREMLDLKTGDIADGERLSVALYERVKEAYANFGYIQYSPEIEPKFRLKDGAREGIVDFVVTIDEGKAFTIRSIKFEGNGDVPTDTLRRDMMVRNGDVFNHQLFKESLIRINNTGLFEAIDADRDVDYRSDREDPRLDLTIRLKKKSAAILPMTKQ